MKHEDLKKEIGNLIQHCTYENFCKGYDPIIDYISNEEKMILNDLELDVENDNMIKIGTKESYELINFLSYLKPEDPYYKTNFILDFNGNIFYYSRFYEDLFNDFSKSEFKKRYDFLDYNYYYLLDLYILNTSVIEEDLELDKLIQLSEDDFGVFEDE